MRRWLLDPATGRLVAALLGLLAIAALVRFFKRYLSAFIKDNDNRYRARKFVTFVGYATGIVVISSIYSDKLGGLTVAFGVAGAGIAFALQEVIASVAGWLAISAGNFFRTGDRVQLGGIMGDVIDIGILRTTIMECGQWVRGDLYNGRIVRVANSFVFKEPVFNYSGDFHFLWDEIVLPVKFGCDYTLAKSILTRVAEEIAGDYARSAQQEWSRMVTKYMIEDARVEPMVTLLVTENWVEFTVRYVVDYKRRRATKDLLFTRIIEEIDKTGDRVGIASTTLQLVDLPEVRVRLGGRSNPGGQVLGTKLESLDLRPEDIRRDLAATGKVVRRRARDLGEAVIDATADARVAAAIKARLAADPDLSALSISVDTTAGRVTLAGTVTSTDLIGTAMVLALETDGVREIVSTLQVR